MNKEDEKYRIKPRKKYQRQVWLKDGKAIIVDPIEFKDPKNSEKKRLMKNDTEMDNKEERK